ncbi:MAG: flagellar type III secretion system protein FliR [Beijerinckiaceae bacterium]|jgi:flagellar biosynthetic protein FliR|nr:flagellar type III secretion system protein FliR [Beijerinckiaceae bacterium]
MTITILPELAALFMLVFARVGTMVMLMPGLGERFVLNRAKLAIAVFLALLLMPVARPLMQVPSDPAGLMSLLISEILIGAILGLSARLIMAALQTAGVIVANQIGLGFATAVDPAMGQQNPSIGNFLSILGITLVLVTDLHHLAIGAIHNSYTMLPPGAYPSVGDASALGLQAVSKGFSIAVQMSAPFIVFGLLFNLGLGVLARLMPQFQVFFLGAPAAILIGMAILAAIVSIMMTVFLGELGSFLKQLSG